ncbi:MAG: hypothetical protein KGP35_06620 [Bacteroidetes bacterium]|nr:hypothetical protein [Bacteroidota bacterium]
MKLKIIYSLLSIVLISCSTGSNTNENNSTSYKEDPNNYFTATFNGKTLKTVGYILNTMGVTDDVTLSWANINSTISTSNSNRGVQTDVIIQAAGGNMNVQSSIYKTPIQSLDASIFIKRKGNEVGSYTLNNFGSSVNQSSITDINADNKKYDLDPASTVVILNTVDALYLQGSFTGKLIDGSTKIPVSGTFKLRKL